LPGGRLGENSIAPGVKSSIIIRNSAPFFNYNFEIGKKNGKRQKAIGGGREEIKAEGCKKEREKGYRV
jgi:hypothetical protein